MNLGVKVWNQQPLTSLALVVFMAGGAGLELAAAALFFSFGTALLRQYLQESSGLSGRAFWLRSSRFLLAPGLVCVFPLIPGFALGKGDPGFWLGALSFVCLGLLYPNRSGLVATFFRSAACYGFAFFWCLLSGEAFAAEQRLAFILCIVLLDHLRCSLVVRDLASERAFQLLSLGLVLCLSSSSPLPALLAAGILCADVIINGVLRSRAQPGGQAWHRGLLHPRRSLLFGAVVGALYLLCYVYIMSLAPTGTYLSQAIPRQANRVGAFVSELTDKAQVSSYELNKKLGWGSVEPQPETPAPVVEEPAVQKPEQAESPKPETSPDIKKPEVPGLAEAQGSQPAGSPSQAPVQSPRGTGQASAGAAPEVLKPSQGTAQAEPVREPPPGFLKPSAPIPDIKPSKPLVGDSPETLGLTATRTTEEGGLPFAFDSLSFQAGSRKMEPVRVTQGQSATPSSAAASPTLDSPAPGAGAELPGTAAAEAIASSTSSTSEIGVLAEAVPENDPAGQDTVRKIPGLAMEIEVPGTAGLLAEARRAGRAASTGLSGGGSLRPAPGGEGESPAWQDPALAETVDFSDLAEKPVAEEQASAMAHELFGKKDGLEAFFGQAANKLPVPEVSPLGNSADTTGQRQFGGKPGSKPLEAGLETDLVQEECAQQRRPDSAQAPALGREESGVLSSASAGSSQLGRELGALFDGLQEQGTGGFLSSPLPSMDPSSNPAASRAAKADAESAVQSRIASEVQQQKGAQDAGQAGAGKEKGKATGKEAGRAAAGAEAPLGDASFFSEGLARRLEEGGKPSVVPRVQETAPAASAPAGPAMDKRTVATAQQDTVADKAAEALSREKTEAASPEPTHVAEKPGDAPASETPPESRPDWTQYLRDPLVLASLGTLALALVGSVLMLRRQTRTPEEALREAQIIALQSQQAVAGRLLFALEQMREEIAPLEDLQERFEEAVKEASELRYGPVCDSALVDHLRQCVEEFQGRLDVRARALQS